MNTVEKGDKFEEEVFNYLKNFITSGSFYLNPRLCKFFRKKRYYSPLRESDIIVDISIECYMEGNDKYSQLVIIECKDYTSNIPVDDIEEFHSKLSQITGVNVKGIFASRTSFQSGAFKVAKNSGMALLRILPEVQVEWVLQRNPISSKHSERIKEDQNTSELALKNDEFIGKTQNIFSYYNDIYTSSFMQFLNKVFCGEEKPLHPTTQTKNNIIKSKYLSYLSLEEIDSRSLKLISESRAKETDTPVNLSTVVDYLRDNSDLSFNFSCQLGTDENYASVLGSMDSLKNEIKISSSLEVNSPRWRFTLAHEIGHYLFHHDFMLKNKVGEHFDVDENYSITDFNLSSNLYKKLEWQANMFANSFLMPRHDVFNCIKIMIKQLDIRNFVNGIIYVDDQPCNIHIYNCVISRLKNDFNVSATIAQIRLNQLRILNDARKSPSAFNFKPLNISR